MPLGPRPPLSPFHASRASTPGLLDARPFPAESSVCVRRRVPAGTVLENRCGMGPEMTKLHEAVHKTFMELRAPRLETTKEAMRSAR